MAVLKRLNVVTVDDVADLAEFDPINGLIIHIVATQSTVQGNGSAFVPMSANLALPSSPVNFNSQEVMNFVMENRTSDPSSPAVGRLWLRTDI